MKTLLAFLAVVFLQIVAAQSIDTTFNRAYNLLQTDMNLAVAEVQKLNDEILSFSEEDQVKFHHQAATFYGRVGDFETEALHWQEEIKLTSADADTLHKAVYKLGRSYLNTGKWNEALEQFEKCEEYAIQRNDTLVYAASFDARASVMSQIGDHESAINYYLRSIRVLEKIGKNHALSQAYLNMGVAYLELNDPDKAFESRKTGYAYAQMTNEPYAINKSMFALASSYNDFEQPDSALYYLLPSLAYFEAEQNVRFLNGAYNEMGRTYSIMEEHDSAVVYFEKSIGLLRMVGYEFGLPGTLVNYGGALQNMGAYKKAIAACQEALPIARKMQYPSLESEICGCLYDNFKADNQADSALYYYELHLALEDSINNIEIQKNILTQELESSFSSEKEELIADANEVIQDQVSLRNIWVFGAIVLFGALVILFLAFRQKKKSTAIIQKEKHYLDNLLHNLVHEFRTPLTLIKGPAEELLKSDEENRLLQMVNKNSDQMLSLVNQVLDFAKIKAGRLEVKNEVTHLDIFYKDTIELFQPMAIDKVIELSYKHQGAGSIVKVDADKLFKIISNLLSNAIKYSEDKGSVNFTSNLRGNQLEFSVKDNGIGISPEDQEKVFRKFYQVDATITRKGEGTGLGLAFVQELVQLMGGEIHLKSKLGQGTEITVLLPVELVSDLAEEKVIDPIKTTTQPQTESQNAVDSVEKTKVLIIEDNRDLQEFLGQLLRGQGYEVQVAENGLEGVELATQNIPDLIISDVMMPKMDGYQVVQQVKGNFATEHIPIIILTAKASFDSMLDGLGAGADDYVSKPFKSQELLLRVRNQIIRQQKLQQKYLAGTEGMVIEEKKHALIEKIEVLTKEDLSTQISVEELAEKCSLSRSQLHRKVKFITGLSTTALLTKIRLDLSIEDIKKSDESIAEIAYKYGYNDPAHYSRLFKKQFGKTPTEVRNSGS